jgi:hypothetical protein
VSDLYADTATLRPPTGLDASARRLILKVVNKAVGGGDNGVRVAFFTDRYADVSDYLHAVEAVHGPEVSEPLISAVAEGQESLRGRSVRRSGDSAQATASALLLNMPEPDFRLAVAETLGTYLTDEVVRRITGICRSRGIPWAFSRPDGFEYTGDENVERELVQPALAAVNRAEFAGGTKDHYEAARKELGEGTPRALSQALVEAGSAVESAMKVVLDAHGVQYGERDTASKLFDALVNAGIVERDLENVVLVAMTPRNRRGGHGAGAVAHAVAPAEAEAVVAGASGAIAYLATLLP